MIKSKISVHSKELFSFSSQKIGNSKGNKHEGRIYSPDKKYKVS